jgi:protein phosphatase PTC1
VTAFLRIEDAEGRQSFLTSPIATQPSATTPNPEDTKSSRSGSESPVSDLGEEASGSDKTSKKNKKANSVSPTSRFARALKNFSGGGGSPPSSPGTPTPSPAPANHANTSAVISPPPSLRRVLYTANAGDARGVLCRAGKAVRLTYDHKGSDKQEAKRITDAGGFVMSGRVNGVLAVTRSLGDSSMKEFVVGSPYTTETQLCDDDEFLILACDGVRTSPLFAPLPI